MSESKITSTFLEDSAKIVINDYTRTKDIFTEKLNAHDTAIANLISSHEQSVNEITEKLGVHDSIDNHLISENTERKKDVAKVQENLQASYDHLIDKIQELNVGLIIALVICLVLTITVTITSIYLRELYIRTGNESTDVAVTTETPDIITEYEFGIAQIGTTGQPKIIYDKDTKVMYLVSENGNHTVILNSDGSPKLYNEEE